MTRILIILILINSSFVFGQSQKSSYKTDTIGIFQSVMDANQVLRFRLDSLEIVFSKKSALQSLSNWEHLVQSELDSTNLHSSRLAEFAEIKHYLLTEENIVIDLPITSSDLSMEKELYSLACDIFETGNFKITSSSISYLEICKADYYSADMSKIVFILKNGRIIWECCPCEISDDFSYDTWALDPIDSLEDEDY